jgi:hypothetical protein
MAGITIRNREKGAQMLSVEADLRAAVSGVG